MDGSGGGSSWWWQLVMVAGGGVMSRSIHYYYYYYYYFSWGFFAFIKIWQFILCRIWQCPLISKLDSLSLTYLLALIWLLLLISCNLSTIFSDLIILDEWWQNGKYCITMTFPLIIIIIITYLLYLLYLYDIRSLTLKTYIQKKKKKIFLIPLFHIQFDH